MAYKLGSKNLLSLASDNPKDKTYLDPEKRRIYESYKYPSYEFVLNEDGTRVINNENKYVISVEENRRYRMNIISRCEQDKTYRDLIVEVCKYNILFFVNTFCYTERFDLPQGEDSVVNVCTFPCQDDILTWMVYAFKYRGYYAVSKTREIGATWLWVWFMDWLKFYGNIKTGTMSQKEDQVDDKTSISIFGKLRISLKEQPEWLRYGWSLDSKINDNKNKITLPDASLTHIGGTPKGNSMRGGRFNITFNDEFAHNDEATAALASLSALSTCNFFISTPNGEYNEFAYMALNPSRNVKFLNWNDHPLRTKKWEEEMRKNVGDEVFAQEYEGSFTKSNVGRIFPMFKSTISEDETLWTHVADENDDYYKYNPNYPVHSFSDLGGDGTYFGFFQELPSKHEWKKFTPNVIVVIDEYYNSGSDVTAYRVRKELNEIAEEKGYIYENHITDMRTLDQTPQGGSKNETWMSKMAESRQSLLERFNIDYGEPVYFIKNSRTYPAQIIDNMQNVLNAPGLFIIRSNCKILIGALSNWKYKTDKNQKDINGRPLIITNNKGQPIPDHSQASHPGTAVLYGANYLFGKDKLARNKKKTKRTFNWDFKSFRIAGI